MIQKALNLKALALIQTETKYQPDVVTKRVRFVNALEFRRSYLVLDSIIIERFASESVKTQLKLLADKGHLLYYFSVRKTPGTTNSCVDLSLLLFLPLCKHKLFIYSRLNRDIRMFGTASDSPSGVAQ